jgi:hypothetical protein
VVGQESGVVSSIAIPTGGCRPASRAALETVPCTSHIHHAVDDAQMQQVRM